MLIVDQMLIILQVGQVLTCFRSVACPTRLAEKDLPLKTQLRIHRGVEVRHWWNLEADQRIAPPLYCSGIKLRKLASRVSFFSFLSSRHRNLIGHIEDSIVPWEGPALFVDYVCFVFLFLHIEIEILAKIICRLRRHSFELGAFYKAARGDSS